jgi:hypothetical protein
MINTTFRRSEIVVMLFALALPFKAGGCGSTTCITVTQADLQNGECPSQMVAQMRVTDPNMCFFGSTMTMIEGDGVLDGQLCCYPSSKQSSNGGCFIGMGGGVSTGFGTATTGFGGSTTTGFATCNSALQGAPFDQVTEPQSKADLETLEMCGCNKCTSVCDPTLCTGNKPDDGCMGCLLSSCATELTACQQH